MYSMMTSCLTQDMLLLTDLVTSNRSTRSVEFLFFNPSGRGEPHAVKDPKALYPGDFDPRRKTIVIIHGFSDSFRESLLIPALVQVYAFITNKYKKYSIKPEQMTTEIIFGTSSL